MYEFNILGTNVDNYTAEAMLYHQKFRVAPNKIIGWKRLVGQEVPVDAYSNLIQISGASNWNAAVSNLVDQSGAAVLGSPASASVTARKLEQIVYGPQTPQATQHALDLWIPLIFW